MSYTFKLDQEHEIVEAEYTGTVNFSERKQAIREGLVILQDREYPRILINLIAAQIKLSKPEKLELTQYISEQHTLIQAKTAFLIRCEQTEREEIDNALLYIIIGPK